MQEEMRDVCSPWTRGGGMHWGEVGCGEEVACTEEDEVDIFQGGYCGSGGGVDYAGEWVDSW